MLIRNPGIPNVKAAQVGASGESGESGESGAPFVEVVKRKRGRPSKKDLAAKAPADNQQEQSSTSKTVKKARTPAPSKARRALRLRSVP
jgi:hypothetical protein